MQLEETKNSEITVLGHIPAIRPGETVRYRENNAVVDFVIVRKGDLLVRLHAHAEPVRVQHLQVPLVPVVWRKQRH